jgi:exoribonuclease II
VQRKRCISQPTTQEPTYTTRPFTKQTVTAETHVHNTYIQYKEPLTYKQSQTYSDGNEWEEATQRELQQFDDLEAMLPIRLEEVPEDANITKSKTVYKLKLLRNGDVEKCKARIVAKGYTQEYGVQYTNLFLQHHKYLECVLC